MDRYLYKAKRLYNGEWVTGSLITCEDGTCKIATSCLEGKANEPILVCAYDMDRDTICQCTGLKDKNGNLIWENDVVKATVRQNSLCQSSTYSDFYQVAYHKKNCYFYLKKKNNNLLFDGNWSYYLKTIEVIGNVFDNPELLESEE